MEAKMTVKLTTRRKVRKLCLLGTILVVCVMCQTAVFAQSATTGSINGTVVDTSGAVVPGAIVISLGVNANLAMLRSTVGAGVATAAKIADVTRAVENRSARAAQARSERVV